MKENLQNYRRDICALIILLKILENDSIKFGVIKSEQWINMNMSCWQSNLNLVELLMKLKYFR